jgi:aspartate carbamoyltransferase catalytic subunit
MNWHHIISADQFDCDSIKELFELARNIKKNPGLFHKDLADKVMFELFYQASTRTRFSFDLAMKKLGGRVIGTENARIFSSATKGETLEDTILTITVGLEADIIVLRYDKVGGAKRASQITETPIINAGDGPGEHPTQALLDLFTIQEELGRLNDFTIAMIGDPYHSRTIHSLARLLTLYKNVEIILVSPDEIGLDDETKKYLHERGLKFSHSKNLGKTLKKVDVAYMTRIQEEYFHNPEIYKKVFGQYVLSSKLIPSNLKLIMHPLPRKGEILFEVDKDPRAAYFRQVNYGLYIRMALLKLISDKV